MYEIKYEQLIEHYDHMINTLEYDSMRSGGKAKLNAETLYHLHEMRSRYQKELIPAKKEVKKNGK